MGRKITKFSTISKLVVDYGFPKGLTKGVKSDPVPLLLLPRRFNNKIGLLNFNGISPTRIGQAALRSGVAGVLIK